MISLLSVCAMFAAIVLTITGVYAKILSTALPLSWWAVLCPVPIVLTASFIIYLLCESRIGQRLNLHWD